MGCYFNIKTDPEREERWDWISLIEMDGPRASIRSHNHGQCLFSQRHHLLMSGRSRGYAAAACMEWFLILTSQRRDGPMGRITIASESGIPQLQSVLEISIKNPYPQVDSFQVLPLWGPYSSVSQENDQPSMGLCFLGVLWDNRIMKSEVSWCQSTVTGLASGNPVYLLRAAGQVGKDISVRGSINPC